MTHGSREFDIEKLHFYNQLVLSTNLDLDLKLNLYIKTYIFKLHYSTVFSSHDISCKAKR